MSYFDYNKKNIYYEEIGTGDTLILLHGNTMSSKMFLPVLDLYKNDYKVVLIDFLGHGNSDRVNVFESDFWYDEAKQVKKLIEYRKYEKPSIIGTSGGAIAAINLALEYPELIKGVMADSFQGEMADKKAVSSIKYGRNLAKKSQDAVAFWKLEHGEDWEQVIDNDTDMLERHALNIQSYFHKDVSEIKVPILFTASVEDNLIENAGDIAENLAEKVVCGRSHVFQTGNHPALMSNAREYSTLAKEFLEVL